MIILHTPLRHSVTQYVHYYIIAYFIYYDFQLFAIGSVDTEVLEDSGAKLTFSEDLELNNI